MKSGSAITVNLCRNYKIFNATNSSFRMDYLQQLYARLFGTNPEDVSTAVTISSNTNSVDSVVNNSTTQSTTNSLPRKVVAFGNVLLDHTARISDTELLDRYKLSLNTRGEADVETITKVTTEAFANTQEEDPHLGGSALNTSRILKALGTEPLFFGAVGDDKQAQIVNDLLIKSGMESNNYRLQTISDTPTGRCICLVHKDSLALYANTGASVKFSIDFLEKVQQEENLSSCVIQVVSRFSMLKVSLCHNASCHHLHCEFETLRECWGAKDIEELIRGILEYAKGPKIFVMTKGADGVELITNYEDELSAPGDLRFEMFKTSPVENIVDTTGCGDAFAAAFLHAWLEKRILSECVRFANDISAKVATQIGCNLP
ncbi:hypothetical protein DOY81_009697 [Sarcophaga bullata]|nr:hypothetical protein DOY81_009697 [Sarcophaga bullata]